MGNLQRNLWRWAIGQWTWTTLLPEFFSRCYSLIWCFDCTR